jgi:hypothetical protein
MSAFEFTIAAETMYVLQQILLAPMAAGKL